MIFFLKVLGKTDISKRLIGSLQVDNSKTNELLGWKPVVSMDEQLEKMSKDFKKVDWSQSCIIWDISVQQENSLR